jgi:GH25 family lysozyme M1 (1,4-beta-N-acetylmuramidase)
MTDTRALGADISQHNASFTFRGNLDFIVLRASQGTTADERFRSYLPEALKVPVRGAYLYLRSSLALEPQLEKFLAVIQGVDLHFLALDFERIGNVLSQGFAQMALRGLESLDASAGKTVLFYTNPSTWDEGIRPFLSAQELQRLATHELWVAQWPKFPNEALTRTTQRPFLAQGMGQWTLWQFSADAPTHPDRGSEFGVASSKIDLDVFNGTREAMLQRFVPQPVVVDTQAGPTVSVTTTVTTTVSTTTTEAVPRVTNQQMINAFFKAANALEMDGFGMVLRAGLESMAIPDSNRALPYSGPPIGLMPNLTDEEKAALRAALAG